MTLFARFFLVLLAFSLAPVVATGAWFLRSTERTQESAREFHRQITGLSAAIVDDSVARLNRTIGFVQDLERLAANEAQELVILHQAVNTFPALALVSILDASGRETARVAAAALFKQSRPAQRGSDPLVREALRTGVVRISPVELIQGAPALRLVHPLSGGRAVYAVYALDDLWERIRTLEVGSEGRILLIDAEGRPLPGLIEGFPEPGWKGPGALTEKEGWLESIPTAAGPMVGGYTLAGGLGWRVLSLQPRAEAFAVGENFLFQALSFLGLIAVLVAGAAIWITGRLTRPLNALVGAAKKASRNEFDQKVPEVGWGELDLLSTAFNEMMGQLKAYEELQVGRIMQEKAKVEALIHTIPDGIVLAGFDGKIAYMNASARSILGAGAEDTAPKNRSVRELLREPVLRDLVTSLLSRRKKTANAEFELLDGNGQRRGVFLCRGVTVTRDKHEIGVLVLMRDVTAERDFDRMKEEFFHSIVHDIRSPLGTIDGFVQIMKERGDMPEKAKMYINYIQGSCDRLRSLVSDILDTAKIESGQLKLEPQPLDVEETLKRMRDLYHVQGETRGIQLGFVKGAQAAAPLLCDRNLIERVVMNLIGNAMKFTPKGGRITLQIGAAGPAEVEFSVSDTGPGIPKDKLEMVFEKFKQLGGPAARAGYGLGLSICKKVVELHGGRIWAESEEGKGSRFIFRLPLNAPAPANAAS